MEEKFNALYAKEAEFVNVSAKAAEIHETRKKTEAILSQYKAKEGMEITE